MSKNKKSGQNPETVAQPKRVRWIVAGVIVAGAIGGFVSFRPASVSHAPDPDSSSGSATAPSGDNNTASAAQPEGAGKERLVGRWLRPDGGYILEIRSATAEGKLEAGYFNPGPIHVARAEWQWKDGKLQVIVELRDVNYPGSTYTLEFSATEDRMTGNYFQATQRENFAVEFVRQE